MKVRALITLSTATGLYHTGEVFDAPSPAAEAWIKAGFVEAADDSGDSDDTDDSDDEVEETAMVPVVKTEKAVLKRKRRKG
jgi:hypothetical protein